MSKRRSAGFTVTELMIVITIAGILAAIGVPTYRGITNNARISGEVNGLLGDLMIARSEAIKQGWPVTVCVPANTAYNACATTGLSWASGWIMFVDFDGDQTVDGTESVTKIQTAFTGSDTFVSDNTRAITFNREGFATLKAGATTNSSTLITLHAASPTTTSTRCVSANQLGRITIQKAGTGSCS